jgi:hypothetical protein
MMEGVKTWLSSQAENFVDIVTCYLLTRRIIRGLRIFVPRFIGYTSGGVYNHL